MSCVNRDYTMDWRLTEFPVKSSDIRRWL